MAEPALALLIAEQRRDDTTVVFPERRGDHSLNGLENMVGVVYDFPSGELIAVESFLPRPRGSVLVGGADWHGTESAYVNLRCRCARCRNAASAARLARLHRRRAA